jgi:hypothetical protein
MPDKSQGVAQRVILEHEQHGERLSKSVERATSGTSRRHLRNLIITNRTERNGALALHAELSKEARAILAELRTKLVESEPESYSDGDVAVHYEYLDSLNAQIRGVQMMAKRLGLDLEGEGQS